MRYCNPVYREEKPFFDDGQGGRLRDALSCKLMSTDASIFLKIDIEGTHNVSSSGHPIGH